MSLANLPAKVLDSWDYSTERQARPVTTRKVESIPDDWDDDDDEDEEDPHRLWQTANSKAPMPEVIILTNNSTTISPPPAAIQPALRILKRPSPSPQPSSSTFVGDSQQKSFAEREAQYQAARDRIFGDNDIAGSRIDNKPRKLSPAPSHDQQSVSIVHQPRGPDLPSNTTIDPQTEGAGTNNFAGRRSARSRNALSAVATSLQSND